MFIECCKLARGQGPPWPAILSGVPDCLESKGPSPPRASAQAPYKTRPSTPYAGMAALRTSMGSNALRKSKRYLRT